MPSFDITSEVDMVALRNAVEGANRKITGRYDFKGSDARVEQTEKLLTLYGDTEFQLDQMQAILLPEMTGQKIDVPTSTQEFDDVPDEAPATPAAGAASQPDPLAGVA